MNTYDDNNLESTLIYIKNTFGIEIFSKQEKLIAYISDLAPRLKNEKSMLKRIAQLGILEDFIHSQNSDKTNQEHIIAKALKILIDDEYIQEKIATEYIITVAKVLDLNVSKFVSQKEEANIAIPQIDTTEKTHDNESLQNNNHLTTPTPQNNNPTSNKNNKIIKVIAFLLAIIFLAQIIKTKLSSKPESEIPEIKDTINIPVTTQNRQNPNVVPITFFSGQGSGTSADPYVVTTINNLNEIKNNLSACYILGNNIDLADISNWSPIGNENKPFTGIFDGNGYKINNLKINVHSNLNRKDTKNSELGLFGNIENAIIKNLGIENASYNITYESFDGDDAVFVNVGGIVSVMKASMINQSYFTGKIVCNTGKGIFIRVAAIGCIVTDSSHITNCYSNADLYANGTSHNTMVSGITAWLTDSVIEKCYVSGNIIGSNSTSYVYAGGINASGGSGYVKNCISILKKLDASGQNSYSDSIGNYSTKIDCTAMPFGKVKISTYTNHGWDFKNIWIADKSSYPLLRIFAKNTNSSDTSSIPSTTVAQNTEIQSSPIEQTRVAKTIVQHINNLTSSTERHVQEGRDFSKMTTSQLYDLAFQNYIPPNDTRTGIKEDYSKAIKYFLAAAEKGHKEAQF